MIYMLVSRAQKILRLTNVVVAYLLVDRLLHINDLKSRMDHETEQMVKKFWDDVSNVYNDFADNDYNDFADNDDGQLRIVDNTEDEDSKNFIELEEGEINLSHLKR
jgi:hypothetical protein